MDRRAWYRSGIALTVLILIVALVAIASTGCGSTAGASTGPLKLSEADDGKAFTVEVGDTVEVVIAGNPTTGFEWMAAIGDKDSALIEQIGEAEYVPDATDADVVGAGGTYTLTFKTLAEGEALLRLVYARSWESVSPEKTFEVTLTVE